MIWLSCRADLSRAATTINRREVLFLVTAATAIVVAAQTTDPGTVGELLLVVVAAGGLVLFAAADRIPRVVVAVLVMVLVASAMWRGGNLEVALFLGVLVTLYSAWHLGSLVKALVVMAGTALCPFVVSVANPEAEIGWTPWVAASVLTFVLGRNLRRQRVLIEQLEAAREALAERAVANERQHIARELHDLAGHTLVAVLLHVTGARHVLHRDRYEAERALLQAETTGRASLDQIRYTVASLRTSERGTDHALPSSGELTALVEQYRRAGLAVTALVTERAAGIDGPVGTALHRIGREALANVARHAPGNSVELTADVDADADEIRLVVADHGRPPAAQDSADGHFGLVGMRERARALGGELEAGPTVDGWRVAARLPLTDAGLERSPR
ncbi:MAG: sensor histidine kinase [Acidimicrobiales bacterium]